MKSYYVYVLECEGACLYTGITGDLKKRMSEHFLTLAACAKFTRSHKPKSIVCLWKCPDKSAALKAEAAIKKLKRTQKDELIKKAKDPAQVLGDEFSQLSFCEIPHFDFIPEIRK